jgi:hypothetical protein
MIQIAVINESTILSDHDVAAAVKAIQIQVVHDFYPIWGLSAGFEFFTRTAALPPSFWQMAILDDADAAGELGYHDITAANKPLGKVFAKTSIDGGSSWTVTFSHETVEILADPWINRCVEVVDRAGKSKFVACEVGDPVEDDSLGYPINIDGTPILVSDFITPEWFGGSVVVEATDFQRHTAKTLDLLVNGYIMVFDPATGWGQLNGPAGKHSARKEVQPGSRRERRMRGIVNWKASTK